MTNWDYTVGQSRRLFREGKPPARHAEKAWRHSLLADERHAKARRKICLHRQGIVALVGPRGTGKTQIAVEEMCCAAHHGLSSLYCKAHDMFVALRSGFSGESDYVQQSAKFIRPRLLVIDEVAVRRESDWEQEELTNLIDSRYDNMRFTIIIANLVPDELASSMGRSIMSRLEETGAVIECDWRSFRCSTS
jgi:DNA replication protein DnaC